jgi:hypothetical protein
VHRGGLTVNQNNCIMLVMNTWQPQQPDPALLAFWDQLAEHLRTVLPPPLGKTPEDLATAQAALNMLVRRLAPVDDAEAELACQYIITSAESAFGLHYAGGYPANSKLGMTLRTQSARLRHKAQRIKLALLTAQDERRRREATNVTVLPRFPRPDGYQGAGADSVTEAEVAATLPAQPATLDEAGGPPEAAALLGVLTPREAATPSEAATPRPEAATPSEAAMLPEAVKPATSRRSRPVLRLIQGGLASQQPAEQ